MYSYNHFGCSCYGGPFNGRNCPGCSSVGSGKEFVYDLNPNSFDNPLDFSYQSPQPQYKTYSCELCGNDAHYGYNCSPQFGIEFSKLRILLETSNKPEDIQELFRKLFNDVQNIYEELAEYINTSSWNRPAFYNNNEDDDEDFSILMSEIYKTSLTAITPDLLITDSLIMKDGNLDTIPEKKSDEFIKSSVENLVPNPSESEDLSNIRSECNVPVGDDFTTFSNSLFDADEKFSSSVDESFSDEDVLKEIYSNPLFDEEIISIKIDPHYFNVESDHIESLLNQDSSIISSPKIDSLLEEFSKPNSENSDAVIKSISLSPISVEGSNSLMEEIDIFLAPDDSIPPGIENNDYDSVGDILFLEELLSNDSLSHLEK
uniref:Uncharacterized protein n=1 Tax=Tanacetum cinerariifolium TaxID=118510 RepID=A0A699GZM6_TANCI|nr:hypothetical protein [Tanacetum cinerariifolium]